MGALVLECGTMKAARSVFWVLALCAVQAQATDLTVGPHGAYGSIQGAINAALAVDGDYRILVEQGTYHEALAAEAQQLAPPAYPGAPRADRCFNGRIKIQGGFNENFATKQRSPDPADTVIHNLWLGSVGPTLSLIANDCYGADTQAEFAVSNVTLRSPGSVLYASAGPGGRVHVTDSVIDQSGHAGWESPIVLLESSGLYGAPGLRFSGNRVEHNQTGGAPIIRLVAASNNLPASAANLRFESNTVQDNAVTLTAASLPLLRTIGGVFYPALENTCAATQVFLWAKDVWFTHNVMQRNQCLLAASLGPVPVLSADTLVFPVAGEALFEHNHWAGTNAQAALLVKHSATTIATHPSPINLMVRNNVITHSLATGLMAVGAPDHGVAATPLQLAVFNNTFFRNSTGIHIQPSRGVQASAVNNIFWRQVVDMAGDLEARSNSSSAQDPGFVGESWGNYCLRAGSPFVDTGVALDSGWQDAYGYARWSGGGVNLGALECNL